MAPADDGTVCSASLSSDSQVENSQGRVFWVAGEHEVLVDPVLTKGAAAEYGVDMAVVTGAG